MSRLGLKTTVFHGDFCLGEVEILCARDQTIEFPNNEIRITYISPPSERCPPLSILQTISSFTVRCKLKSIGQAEYLSTLYFSCLRELKTAVLLMGSEELHLVAMPSKQEKLPCFWCCSVPLGLYGSCLWMLNLRCLAIVFDLDETLIVANTMKSFEDRVEFLQKRLESEEDPLRVSGMSAELRRYVEDRALLRQYVENDSVSDNGKSFGIQFEEVQSLANIHEKIIRPVIRLKDRNIVLTRIQPENRDTSVLVRLRPAWEDLRSYLNAKGRKRFEVYVCTMAERDYALEMWRLLDPEAHLINSNQLLSRVVCVKPGARKSLSSVFQDGMCHPKMAMVIDDRLKVWEDNDQPRVHVVPAFTPYYAPQAETANAVPVLCVARNVACNVRAGFFKEFDENLLRRIFELYYEDDVANLPYSPDVSDFLMSEDTGFVPNGNRDVPISEGINGAEVERSMNNLDEMHAMDIETPLDTKVPDSKLEVPPQPVSLSPNVVGSEASRTNLPCKSGFPDSTSRHGQDVREQYSSDPSSPRLPTNVSSLPVQSSGGWLMEGDSGNDQTRNQPPGPAPELDASRDKRQAHQNLPCSKTESILLGPAAQISELKSEEAYCRLEGKKQNPSLSNQSVPSEGALAVNQANKDPVTELGKNASTNSYEFIWFLQEIGRLCGVKIEFRSVVNTSKDLQFSVEALYNGEKIGAGMGKTKKDAQNQAAEDALRNLADEYLAYVGSNSGPVGGESENPSLTNGNGFLWDDDPVPAEVPKQEALHNSHTPETGGGALGGLKSIGNQDDRMPENLPRSSETVQNRSPKGEVARGIQIGTSQFQKNGNAAVS